MTEPLDELEQERVWIEQSREDIAQFRPLYEKYYDALYRFFVRRTDDNFLSEELCSQTFCQSLDKLHQFEWKGKPFGAWLFKIASNILRKYFRDKKPIYIIEEDQLDCMEEFPGFQDEGRMAFLIRVLEELPESDLRLLELKYFEKCSFKEMSSLLDMGESAVKMRLYRLLSRLKALWEKSYDEARF